MSYKICSKCHKNKHKAKSFPKDKSKSDGYYSSCKDCYRQRIGAEKRLPREKKTRNGEILRRCGTCKLYKERRKFYSNRASSDGIHRECKHCSIERSKSESAKIGQKGRRQRERMEILMFYSDGDPKCNCCGEKEYKFLSVDHIDGNGNVHRREVTHVDRWIRKNNFPKGFQVLCYNCNLAKGFYGECPHKL